MWRAFFIALGISLCLLGLECLVLDRIVLSTKAKEQDPPKATSLFDSGTKPAAKKDFRPKDWHPWSLMSVGAVIILYSYSIPKRSN